MISCDITPEFDRFMIFQGGEILQVHQVVIA